MLFSGSEIVSAFTDPGSHLLFLGGSLDCFPSLPSCHTRVVAWNVAQADLKLVVILPCVHLLGVEVLGMW